MKSAESKTQLEQDQEQLLHSALLEKLKLTPQQRIESHQAALDLIYHPRVAGEALRAKPK